MTPSDKPTSERTSAGERAEQVRVWVAEHGDRLFSYALARVTDRTTAEELVQETFLAALKNLDQFGGTSAAATWLTGILRHKLHDHYRHARRRREMLGAQQQCDSGESVEEGGVSPKRWSGDPARAFEDREFWRVFDACRGELPSHLADAFALREIDQLNTEEICRILNISATNLSVRIHRARMLLRKCLEDRWFAPD